MEVEKALPLVLELPTGQQIKIPDETLVFLPALQLMLADYSTESRRLVIGESSLFFYTTHDQWLWLLEFYLYFPQHHTESSVYPSTLYSKKPTTLDERLEMLKFLHMLQADEMFDAVLRAIVPVIDQCLGGEQRHLTFSNSETLNKAEWDRTRRELHPLHQLCRAPLFQKLPHDIVEHRLSPQLRDLAQCHCVFLMSAHYLVPRLGTALWHHEKTGELFLLLQDNVLDVVSEQQGRYALALTTRDTLWFQSAVDLQGVAEKTDQWLQDKDAPSGITLVYAHQNYVALVTGRRTLWNRGGWPSLQEQSAFSASTFYRKLLEVPEGDEIVQLLGNLIILSKQGRLWTTSTKLALAMGTTVSRETQDGAFIRITLPRTVGRPAALDLYEWNTSIVVLNSRGHLLYTDNEERKFSPLKPPQEIQDVPVVRVRFLDQWCLLALLADGRLWEIKASVRQKHAWKMPFRDSVTWRHLPMQPEGRVFDVVGHTPRLLLLTSRGLLTVQTRGTETVISKPLQELSMGYEAFLQEPAQKKPRLGELVCVQCGEDTENPLLLQPHCATFCTAECFNLYRC
jgi:hypothetical protein